LVFAAHTHPTEAPGAKRFGKGFPQINFRARQSSIEPQLFDFQRQEWGPASASVINVEVIDKACIFLLTADVPKSSVRRNNYLAAEIGLPVYFCPWDWPQNQPSTQAGILLHVRERCTRYVWRRCYHRKFNRSRASHGTTLLRRTTGRS